MSGLTYEQFSELDAKYQAGTATVKDLETLEPYRAKRAVLFASGFGSRMLPITINTPKPLVNVNGRKIICSLLDPLVEIGVDEIIIVTGYLQEQFELLLRDYPMVRLVENPMYDITNNISSACAAVKANPQAFCNAYAFESDLWLQNTALLKKYRFESCYLGVKADETPDWCFDTQDGFICDLHKGGSDCHLMYGISYWTPEDGRRLAVDLPECFQADDETKQRFWDDVPCVLRRENYKLRVDECTFDGIAEIDSFAELQEIDARYRV